MPLGHAGYARISSKTTLGEEHGILCSNSHHQFLIENGSHVEGNWVCLTTFVSTNPTSADQAHILL